MQWFKFYGQNFLTDSKIGALNPLQKLLWVVLLCIASQDDEKTGVIKYLTEERLKELAGISDNPNNNDWLRTHETLETFCNIGIVSMPDKDTIIITNFQRLQQKQSTSTERVRKYRELIKAQNDDKNMKRNETNVTLHETQNETLDKNRIDKNIKENNTKEKKVTKVRLQKKVSDETLVSEEQEFIDQWNVCFKTSYKLTQERKEKYRTRRKEFTKEQIQTAVVNLSRSYFHTGRNDRGWVADPDYLLRNDQNIDKALNLKPQGEGTERKVTILT